MQPYKRWAIFTAAFFLVISAALINGVHLYYMAALLLTLPWVSYLLGMFALRDLEFAREVPGMGWEGETATFYVVVHSRARTPRLFLQAEDSLPDWLRLEEEAPPLFNAAPRATTKVPYRVELLKRGAYRLDQMVVTALDPLGIFSFSRRVPVSSEILVYPMPQPIQDILLSGAERYGFRDLPIAATRGSGIDPDGVREYVPGDPLRRMHWKSTARTGRLNVIEFEESRAVNVVLVLDLHQGSNVGEGKETTLEYLIRAAASLAQNAIRQGASVRLVTGDTAEAWDFGGRGSDHFFTILAGMARAEATDPNRLSARLVARVGVLPPGTTLVILTATVDPALPGALAHYAAGGTQVVVLYADPLSFARGARIPTREAQQSFLEGLLGAQVTPLLVRHNAEHRLRLEPIEGANLFA